MSSELRIEDAYQNFVSPKRKRMMSPNNCIKISKDQSSTHVQKHKNTDLDNSGDLMVNTVLRRHAPMESSTSGSPSTNCFIRKPNYIFGKQDDISATKFGSLKKGNLFGGNDGFSRSYSSDDDLDGDADDKANRRMRDLSSYDNEMALKKAFANGRNFRAVRRGSNSSANGTDHENLQLDTDAGTESDYSGVAGKMSTLSVGKRSSGFSYPNRRGSPGSSPPTSQNSSMNSSSLGLSPTLNQRGGLTQGLMEDLLSADAAGSPHAQLDLKGRKLFANESLPSRSLRSKANKLISSAIFNNNVDNIHNTVPAAAATPVAHQKSSSGALQQVGSQSNNSVLHNSGSSSANNTHINQYHAADHSGLSHRSDHTDALFHSSSAANTTTNSSNISINSSNGSNDSDRYQRRHNEGDRDREGEHLALGRSVWGEEGHAQQHLHHPHLPPRTPLVHHQQKHTPLHHHHHSHQSLHHHHHIAAGHSAHCHSLSRIEEGEATAAVQQVGKGESYSSSVGAITYDAAGSPVLTPSRGGRRRRGECSTHTHSQSAASLKSMSASMSMSQQSLGHEEAMGDLGTPVAEVGSPVELEGMEDLVGEDDDDFEDEMDGISGEDEEVYEWVDDNNNNVEKRKEGGPIGRVSTRHVGKMRPDDEDPEVAMITAMQGSSASRQQQQQHHGRRLRKVLSPFSADSTAGPKGRLFEDDGEEEERAARTPLPLQRGLTEDDHQYHLFAQQFMVSPTFDDGALQDEGEQGPRQYKYHRSSSSEDYPGHKQERHRQHQGLGLDDTLLDSPSSLNSSAAGTRASGGGGGGSNGSSFSSSLSLTRTNSDMGASLQHHQQQLSRSSRGANMNLTRNNSDTFSLSRSDCNNSASSTASHTGSSSAFLPLPDQSAFDGAGQADLSRSGYDLHLSSSHNSSVDPLFPTPGSARKKRPVQQVGSPNAVLPSPLRGLEWGLLGAMGSPAGDRKLHRNRHGVSQEAHDQLNASSSSAGTIPAATGGVQGGGIAMQQQLLRHPSSEGSVGSAGSHDSDIIIAHHWQRKALAGNGDGKRSQSNSGNALDALSYGECKDPFHFTSSGSSSHNPRLPHGQKSGHNSNNNSHSRLPFESADSSSPSPGGSFSSLSARPALVRQSSLLDTKLLLVGEQEADLGGPGSHSAAVSFREDFEEVGLLGSGTFADVYKVRQVTPGSDPEQYFAVKKSKQQFKSKRDREWLMAEVRTMKLVGQQQHQGGCPYVVPFIRAWQEDCYFYVQMGFAERGTLRELLLHLARSAKSGVNTGGNGTSAPTETSALPHDALVPDSTLWQVVHDVTAGLHHLHACGMVHLDIKPANLLITAQGRVQIGDFGMAAPINSSDDGREGDTRYMAEELLNNPARQPSADVYSLGISLYELACFCTDEAATAAVAAASSENNNKSNQGIGAASSHDFPLRITSRLGLPSNGTLWHTLREDRAPALPAHRSHILQQLLNLMMRREPTARPSTAQILSLADVAAAEGRVDPVLLSAPKHSDIRRGGGGGTGGFPGMPPMARSSSVQEIMARGGSAPTVAGLGLSNGLTVAIDSNNQIDYAALGDGAFTPNFGHGNYSPR